ncbi:transient-receptor-potential-like protein [Trichonephila clavipes]|nr:transient-receptor-potential-like protein [Trichonephila clavipes]
MLRTRHIDMESKICVAMRSTPRVNHSRIDGKLSWELEHLAMKENEFKEIYIELSNQCKKYSCDLLDLCRSTEEVIAVLNKKTDSGSHQDHDPDQLTLSRLKLALKYEQKQFTCRSCGGGDRGRVAIYRPFGEISLSLNRTVTCMVLKANDRRTSCPCHDEFRGPRSDYVR